jgi:CBS domain-containing protein
MGDFNVSKIIDAEGKNKFYQEIVKDLDAFEWMLQNNAIEQKGDMIGAEQELCLVDKYMNPSIKALEILKEIDDEHYTNELALFNLEINSDPERLIGKCFSNMEKKVLNLIKKGDKIANKYDSNIILAGILPTIKYRHLSFENMTPEPRYKVISDELMRLRGNKFEIYLEGVDDLSLSLNSVLFEACNTSFQLHLQIHPDEFVAQHNWAQMISGPVLSVATNSPLLFGRELWAETRIALFKQSLDTRDKNLHTRKKTSRVYFGENWINNSAAELWKKDVIRFPLILQATQSDNNYPDYKNGEVPKLKSVRLHNGTTYTWNRLCYGINNNIPHIRIECRYIPAGPTVADEFANFMFWIGLMKGQPEELKEFYKNTDFRIARDNFIKASRTGINTVFNWMGESMTAHDLILKKLLGYARKGLEKHNVDSQDIDFYLGIIEERVKSNQTGSEWLVKNMRTLTKTGNEATALQSLVKETLAYQNENIPVHLWKNKTINHPTSIEKELLVEDKMNCNIFTINSTTSVNMAANVMKWKNIHHLPIENENEGVIGVLHYEDLLINQFKPLMEVNQVNNLDYIKLTPSDSLKKAKNEFKAHKKDFALVFEGDIFCGIITDKDLV